MTLLGNIIGYFLYGYVPVINFILLKPSAINSCLSLSEKQVTLVVSCSPLSYVTDVQTTGGKRSLCTWFTGCVAVIPQWCGGGALCKTAWHYTGTCNLGGGERASLREMQWVCLVSFFIATRKRSTEFWTFISMPLLLFIYLASLSINILSTYCVSNFGLVLS